MLLERSGVCVEGLGRGGGGRKSQWQWRMAFACGSYGAHYTRAQGLLVMLVVVVGERGEQWGKR